MKSRPCSDARPFFLPRTSGQIAENAETVPVFAIRHCTGYVHGLSLLGRVPENVPLFALAIALALVAPLQNRMRAPVRLLSWPASNSGTRSVSAWPHEALRDGWRERRSTMREPWRDVTARRGQRDATLRRSDSRVKASHLS